MNCGDVLSRLSAALDGELALEDTRDVRQHVDGCAACARRYRTLQQVRAAVRATSFAGVDAARFDARVLERVHHDARSVRLSGPWIAAAATLVIAVASAVLMLQERAVVTPVGRVAVSFPSGVADRPAFDAGRIAPGLDCGVDGAVTCIVERHVPPGLIAGN